MTATTTTRKTATSSRSRKAPAAKKAPVVDPAPAPAPVPAVEKPAKVDPAPAAPARRRVASVELSSWVIAYLLENGNADVVEAINAAPVRKDGWKTVRLGDPVDGQVWLDAVGKMAANGARLDQVAAKAQLVRISRVAA
jgi:hypothetical protein